MENTFRRQIYEYLRQNVEGVPTFEEFEKKLVEDSVFRDKLYTFMNATVDGVPEKSVFDELVKNNTNDQQDSWFTKVLESIPKGIMQLARNALFPNTTQLNMMTLGTGQESVFTYDPKKPAKGIDTAKDYYNAVKNSPTSTAVLEGIYDGIATLLQMPTGFGAKEAIEVREDQLSGLTNEEKQDIEQTLQKEWFAREFASGLTSTIGLGIMLAPISSAMEVRGGIGAVIKAIPKVAKETLKVFGIGGAIEAIRETSEEEDPTFSKFLGHLVKSEGNRITETVSEILVPGWEKGFLPRVVSGLTLEALSEEVGNLMNAVIGEISGIPDEGPQGVFWDLIKQGTITKESLQQLIIEASVGALFGTAIGLATLGQSKGVEVAKGVIEKNPIAKNLTEEQQTELAKAVTNVVSNPETQIKTVNTIVDKIQDAIEETTGLSKTGQQIVSLIESFDVVTPKDNQLQKQIANIQEPKVIDGFIEFFKILNPKLTNALDKLKVSLESSVASDKKYASLQILFEPYSEEGVLKAKEEVFGSENVQLIYDLVKTKFKTKPRQKVSTVESIQTQPETQAETLKATGIEIIDAAELEKQIQNNEPISDDIDEADKILMMYRDDTDVNTLFEVDNEFIISEASDNPEILIVRAKDTNRELTEELKNKILELSQAEHKFVVYENIDPQVERFLQENNIAYAKRKAKTEKLSDVLSSGDALNDIIKRIDKEANLNLDIVWQTLPRSVYGFYERSSGKIYINERHREDLSTVIRHEFAHALTSNLLKQNRDFDNEITSIRTYIIDQLSEEERRRISDFLVDNHELIAGIFERNHKLLDTLATIKSRQNTKIRKGLVNVLHEMLETIKQYIANVINPFIQPYNTSVLDDIFISLDTYLQPYLYQVSSYKPNSKVITVNGVPLYYSDKIEFSQEQLNAIEQIADFIDKSEQDYLVLNGVAGSGKSTITTLMRDYATKKGAKIYYCATTNKAALVQNLMEPNTRATTVHSLFGMTLKWVDTPQGLQKQLIAGHYHIASNSIVIIDEVSQLKTKELELIEQIARRKNLRILFVGDELQLPPVGEKESPVFKRGYPEIKLQEVQRSNENSIIRESTYVRQHGVFSYINDNAVTFVNSVTNILPEFKKLADNILHIRFVTATNRRVAQLNSMVRKYLFGRNVPMFVKGDILMGYSTTTDKGFINGVDYIVTNVQEVTQAQILGNTINVKGYKLDLVEAYDSSKTTTVIVPTEVSDDLIQVVTDVVHLLRDMHTKDILDQFYNSVILTDKIVEELKAILPLANFLEKNADYAYAITSHKAQGSTYNYVIVDEDAFARNTFDENTTKRARYTAVTRASQQVYVYSQRARTTVPVEIIKPEQPITLQVASPEPIATETNVLVDDSANDTEVQLPEEQPTLREQNLGISAATLEDITDEILQIPFDNISFEAFLGIKDKILNSAATDKYYQMFKLDHEMNNPEVPFDEYLDRRLRYLWNAKQTKREYDIVMYEPFAHTVQVHTETFILDGKKNNTTDERLILESLIPELEKLFGKGNVDIALLGKITTMRGQESITSFVSRLIAPADRPAFMSNFVRTLRDAGYIYIDVFGDKDTIPLLKIKDDSKMNRDIIRQLHDIYVKALQSHIPNYTHELNKVTLGETIRAIIEDLKHGLTIEDILSGNSIVTHNPLSYHKLQKRSVLANVMTHLEIDKTITDYVQSNPMTGIYVKDGQVYIKTAILDAKTVPNELKPMFYNIANILRFDGATFYLKGEFDNLWRKVRGIFSQGVIKNLVYNGQLFLKHAMFGLSSNNKLTTYMRANGIAVLSFTDTEKFGLIEPTSYEDFIQGKAKVVDIPLNKFYAIKETKETKESAKGLRQALYSSHITKETLPELSILEDYIDKQLEKYHQNTTKLYDNPARIASMLRRGAMNSTIGGLREVARMFLGNMTEGRLNNLKGMLRHPILRSFYEGILKYDLDSVVNWEVDGTRPVLVPDMGGFDTKRIDKITLGIKWQLVRDIPFLKSLGFDKNVEFNDEIQSAADWIQELLDLRLSIRHREKQIIEAKKEGRETISLTKEIELLNSTYNELYDTITDALKDIGVVKTQTRGIVSLLPKTDTVRQAIEERKLKVIDANGFLREGYVIISKELALAKKLFVGDRIIHSITPTQDGLALGTSEILLVDEDLEDNAIIFNSDYIQMLGKDYDVDDLLIWGKPTEITRKDWDRLCDAIDRHTQNLKKQLADEYRRVLPNLEDKSDIEILASPEFRTAYMKALFPLSSEEASQNINLAIFNNYQLGLLFRKDVAKIVNERTAYTMLVATKATYDGKPIVKKNIRSELLRAIRTHHQVDFPKDLSKLEYNEIAFEAWNKAELEPIEDAEDKDLLAKLVNSVITASRMNQSFDVVLQNLITARELMDKITRTGKFTFDFDAYPMTRLLRNIDLNRIRAFEQIFDYKTYRVADCEASNEVVKEHLKDLPDFHYDQFIENFKKEPTTSISDKYVRTVKAIRKTLAQTNPKLLQLRARIELLLNPLNNWFDKNDQFSKLYDATFKEVFPEILQTIFSQPAITISRAQDSKLMTPDNKEVKISYRSNNRNYDLVFENNGYRFSWREILSNPELKDLFFGNRGLFSIENPNLKQNIDTIRKFITLFGTNYPFDIRQEKAFQLIRQSNLTQNELKLLIGSYLYAYPILNKDSYSVTPETRNTMRGRRTNGDAVNEFPLKMMLYFAPELLDTYMASYDPESDTQTVHMMRRRNEIEDYAKVKDLMKLYDEDPQKAIDVLKTKVNEATELALVHFDYHYLPIFSELHNITDFRNADILNNRKAFEQIATDIYNNAERLWHFRIHSDSVFWKFMGYFSHFPLIAYFREPKIFRVPMDIPKVVSYMMDMETGQSLQNVTKQIYTIASTYQTLYGNTKSSIGLVDVFNARDDMFRRKLKIIDAKIESLMIEAEKYKNKVSKAKETIYEELALNQAIYEMSERDIAELGVSLSGTPEQLKVEYNGQNYTGKEDRLAIELFPEDKDKQNIFLAALQYRKMYDIIYPTALESVVNYFSDLYNYLRELPDPTAHEIALIRVLQKRLDVYGRLLQAINTRKGTYMPREYREPVVKDLLLTHYRGKIIEALQNKYGEQWNLFNENQKAQLFDEAFETEVMSILRVNSTLNIFDPFFLNRILPDNNAYDKSTLHSHLNYKQRFMQTLEDEFLTVEVELFKSLAHQFRYPKWFIEKGIQWFSLKSNNPFINTKPYNPEKLRPGQFIVFYRYNKELGIATTYAGRISQVIKENDKKFVQIGHAKFDVADMYIPEGYKFVRGVLVSKSDGVLERLRSWAETQEATGHRVLPFVARMPQKVFNIFDHVLGHTIIGGAMGIRTAISNFLGGIMQIYGEAPIRNLRYYLQGRRMLDGLSTTNWEQVDTSSPEAMERNWLWRALASEGLINISDIVNLIQVEGEPITRDELRLSKGGLSDKLRDLKNAFQLLKQESGYVDYLEERKRILLHYEGQDLTERLEEIDKRYQQRKQDAVERLINMGLYPEILSKLEKIDFRLLEEAFAVESKNEAWKVIANQFLQGIRSLSYAIPTLPERSLRRMSFCIGYMEALNQGKSVTESIAAGLKRVEVDHARYERAYRQLGFRTTLGRILLKFAQYPMNRLVWWIKGLAEVRRQLKNYGFTFAKSYKETEEPNALRMLANRFIANALLIELVSASSIFTRITDPVVEAIMSAIKLLLNNYKWDDRKEKEYDVLQVIIPGGYGVKEIMKLLFWREYGLPNIFIENRTVKTLNEILDGKFHPTRHVLGF